MDGQESVNNVEPDVPNITKPDKAVPFQVNREAIEQIAVHNQPEELRALGLTVYDQLTFEESILKQVDTALEEQERSKSTKKSGIAIKGLKNGSEGGKRKADNEAAQLVVPSVQNETEQEKSVRLGLSTPFGTTLSNVNKNAQELTSFEKYLLEQEKLRMQKTKQTKKGKSLIKPDKPKKSYQYPTDTPMKSNASKPQSILEAYLINASKRASESNNKAQLGEIAAGKKRKAKDDDKEWATDDSDWEYSEDDEQSKNRRKKKIRRKNGQAVDDGNTQDFNERIANWRKLSGVSQEDDDDDDECEDFEGGYKLPKRVWDRLYNYQKVGVRWMWELHIQVFN